MRETEQAAPSLGEGLGKEEAGRRVRRSASTTVLVMLCTLATRLLGFVKIALIGAIFGAQGSADVWNAVFTIPNNLRKLMAEGALSSAFIPALSSGILEDPSGERARRLTRMILAFQLLILVPLTTLGILFARPVTEVLVPFHEAQKASQAAELFGWVFGYLILVSVSAVLMGVLNSHDRFVIPALSPLLFSVFVIASTLLFSRTLGIFSMAVGILAGGLAQIAIQVPAFRRLGYDLRLDFGFRFPAFRQVIRQWLPILLSSSVFALTQQLAITFASGLADGSTSAISNALVFWQLPFGIFSVSVITVLFPRMSRQSALGDRDGLVASLSYGLQFIFILMIPATLVYLLAGRQIIEVALQRRAFNEQGTRLAAQVLSGYSLGLFSLGGFTFLQRFFYSSRDYRTPLAVALVICAVDVLLSLWLKETALKVIGLAVANSVAFTVGFLLLLAAARARLGAIGGKALIVTGIKSSICMVPLILFILFFLQAVRPIWTEGSSWRNFALIAAALLVSGGITFGLYWLIGIPMIRDILAARRKRS